MNVIGMTRWFRRRAARRALELAADRSIDKGMRVANAMIRLPSFKEGRRRELTHLEAVELAAYTAVATRYTRQHRRVKARLAALRTGGVR